MSKLGYFVGPALCTVLLAAGWPGSVKADGAVALKPIRGQSFDVGNKRAVTYFKAADGICNLTLLMSDRLGDDGAIPATAASRVNVAVAPGKTARIDTAEGKSLEFRCTAGAKVMTVKPLEQVAWTPRTETPRTSR